MTPLDRIGIVADDITGGAAIAGELARLGHVVAIIGVDHVPPAIESVVVETASRYLAAEVAAMQVRAATTRLLNAGYRVVMKKIDSTLKGNVGAELAAFAETCVGPLLIAPSCPEAGLSLVDGVQQTRTGPGANVAELIGHALPTRPASLQLSTVRRGPAAIGHWLQQHPARVVLADAENNEDLSAIAYGAVDAGVTSFSGTYGLGAALASVMRTSEGRGCDTPPIDRLVIIAGSASPVTTRQIENVLAAGAEEIVLDVEVALSTDRNHTQAAHIRRSVEASTAAVIVVHTDVQRTSLRVRERCAQRGWSERDLAERFAGPMAEAASVAGGAGLFFVGGETTGAVLNRLGVTRMTVFGESSPAVPVIFPAEGVWPLLLTKPGAFGTETVLTQVADALLPNWRHPSKSHDPLSSPVVHK